MSKFQVIFLAIFTIFIVAGVALFATFKSSSQDNVLPPITVWGTFSSDVVGKLVSEINMNRDTPIQVNYVQKSEADFNKDFIETLARGQSPDAVLLPQELVARHQDKFVPIPANVITERDFKNTYIPQAELYFDANREVLAMPFSIDPLVMYWNRDIFTTASVAVPPQYWDEFEKLIPKLTKKDVKSNIQRSALALGEFANITNAREILGALLMQSGNPVTLPGDATSGGALTTTLGDGQYAGSKTSEPAISFFTQFANPRDAHYSWNRSLPLSKSWFLSGALATYFGFSSELFDLRAKNPNIDFDVAPLPQPRKSANRITYGTMYGFSIVKAAQTASASYSIIQILTSPDALNILNTISYLPPVRRDMIASGSKDPYQTIFFDSALISRSWLDTNAEKTSRIFQSMIETITSGRDTTYNAIQAASRELELSLLNP